VPICIIPAYQPLQKYRYFNSRSTRFTALFIAATRLSRRPELFNDPTGRIPIEMNPAKDVFPILRHDLLISAFSEGHRSVRKAAGEVSILSLVPFQDIYRTSSSKSRAVALVGVVPLLI
jgi:hypothetical protein